MLKGNFGFLSLIATLSFSSGAMALGLFSDTNSVEIPELGRSIHVEKSVTTNEFAVDYNDLKDVHLKIVTSGDTSRCGEWKQVLSNHRDLDPSFFQRSQLQLRLQVFALNPQAVNRAVGADWTDVSNIAVSNNAVQLAWDDESLVGLAGTKIKEAVAREFANGLNSSAAHGSIAGTGGVTFTIANSLFACDLRDGKVHLTLATDASQFNGFHVPATMRSSDVYTISQRLQAAANLLNPTAGDAIASESLRELNAAGLLGFQLKGQGYTEEVFKNGEFMKLFSKLFENGVSRPTALSESAAEDLVKSMAGFKYEKKDIRISQDLSVE